MVPSVLIPTKDVACTHKPMDKSGSYPGFGEGGGKHFRLAYLDQNSVHNQNGTFSYFLLVFHYFCTHDTKMKENMQIIVFFQ